MVKKFIFCAISMLLLSISLNAQILDPVSWKTSLEKLDNSTYYLVIRADIDPGWHLYSQKEYDDGPVSTNFSFSQTEDYELMGNTEESVPIEKYEETFKMNLQYFMDSAIFKQKIKIKDSNIKEVIGEVFYMVCDDNQCLPPSYVDLNFTFDSQQVSVKSAEDEVSTVEDVKASGSKTKLVDKTHDKDTAVEEQLILSNTIDSTEAEVEVIVDATASKSMNTKKNAVEHQDDKRSLWTIFIIAFISGFAALLTPCVFPMIPMTVSYFTKQSKSKAQGIRNAVIYGVAIIVIYVFLGAIVTWVFGADALNALSTNVWFNLLFFVLIVIFACSFLGAFEIVLPHSWANKVDRQADRNGIIGIFFMALALAIVSFSCTGPIVGTLLVEAASKGGIAPFIGMFGFSLALALPFALFAAFPGWMNSLPKSGGWLNTVKVVLGFFELALAFKFLSNADLVLQLHLLEREVFLAIWIAIFGVLGLYLLGKIRLPHDSSLAHISVGRLSLGLVVLAFTIYLIPGLWGAPLQLISGFPPPQQYSESPNGLGGGGISLTSEQILPRGAELGPHDISSFKDYKAGLAYAKKINKPVLLDFTGYACVNCRKMEERVWSDPHVLQILKEEVVLISLYVDDKRKLPEGEQYVSETTGKKIKTTGNKWSDFQIKKYAANAQPFYVIVNPDGEDLINPVGYTPDIEEYAQWLRDGIDNF
ncbi:MAG: thiol:disulfide interchange protein [Cytophagaceae bacterium]|nr:thiol:disulfide interchange protein [Cytophagaceae bacterium]